MRTKRTIKYVINGSLIGRFGATNGLSFLSDNLEYMMGLYSDYRVYEEVRDKFLGLKFEHINCARNKFKAIDISKVTSFEPYALTVLYSVADLPEVCLKPKKSKDGNSGMMTQDYDFDELEKMLLKRTKS